MKKILILGASILQTPAIKRAKELNLEVVVVDRDSSAVGFQIGGIIPVIESTNDIAAVIEVAEKHRIDGIMTIASDMPVRTVSAVAEELNLTGISEETAFCATNKGAMRRCLARAGVPIPFFFEVHTQEEYWKAIEAIHEKIVVKPVDNAGSRGVSLLTEKSPDLAMAAFIYAKKYSKSGSVMVEEYMEGAEVSVETLSIEGMCHVIQITDKLTTGAPYFVEMGHSEPSMLPEHIKEEVERVACMAVHAIGIKEGPSHTEIKITEEGPKIVEIGARLGGDNITTHLVPLSTGIDMMECCIRIALGEKPDLKRKFCMGSAIRYIQTGVGLIKAVEGMEEASAVSGVKEICLVHGVGDKAVEVKNSVDRVGYVIAQRQSPEEAVRACEEALEHIRIKFV